VSGLFVLPSGSASKNLPGGTTGPDEIRVSGTNQKDALKVPCRKRYHPISGSTPFWIFVIISFALLHPAVFPYHGTGISYAATTADTLATVSLATTGGRYFSPLVRTAHAIRAILFARATLATRADLRRRSCSNQGVLLR
jgi:hypothetical protein